MERQFITFSLGQSIYGINILAVREIFPSCELTEVPLSSDYVMGLLNLRGQIVTVLDLRKPLNLPPNESGKAPSLIIIKTHRELSPIAEKQGISTHDDQVGFLVDRIGDVMQCTEEDVEPVPAHATAEEARHMEGILKKGKTLIGLLNVQSFLHHKGV